MTHAIDERNASITVEAPRRFGECGIATVTPDAVVFISTYNHAFGGRSRFARGVQSRLGRKRH